MNTFGPAFEVTFFAVLRVFLIVAAAGLLVRRRIIPQEHIQALAGMTIKVFLPCLIFSNIVAEFQPRTMPFWWRLPLVGVAMAAVTAGLGALVFWRELPAKKNMIPLAAFQNAAYLTLPLAHVLLPDAYRIYDLYLFLFILSFSPILWTVGKYLSTSAGRRNALWRELITPPFVANVLAVALVLLGVRRWVPAMVLESTELLGSAAVPVANFILGAVLGTATWNLRPFWFDAVRAIGVKLVLAPLLMLIVLRTTGWADGNDVLGLFLMLQAAAAPATGILMQIRHYGGDSNKIGAIMLASYVVCLVSLPFWLALWRTLAR